jgi:hypothetical protein
MAFQQAALAGPPLICHPFDIDNARSLPWSGHGWSQIDRSYNTNRLVEDTLALLTPDAPVLVRMETLRRATVYGLMPTADRTVASSVKDPALARELLSRLKARVPEAGVKSDRKTTAIALFDYGYLVESYKQAGDGSQGPKLAGGVDGCGMIVKAINLGGGDPAMEFAAALAKEDRAGSHLPHLQKAAGGAPDGSLLAKNLVSFFSNMGKTIGELRANVAKN